MDLDFDVVRNFKIHLNLKDNLVLIFQRQVIVPEVKCFRMSPCDEEDYSWRVLKKIRERLTDHKFRKFWFLYTYADANKNRIKCKIEGPFIQNLVDTVGTGIELQIELSKNWIGKSDGFETNHTNIITCRGTPTSKYFENVYEIESSFEGQKLHYELESLSVELSIRVCGKRLQLPKEFIEEAETVGNNYAAEFNKRILSEQIQADMNVIAATGRAFPCHKVYLMGNSEVFARMLKDKSFVEGQTSCIVIDDMSEAGVQSFLDFLYCGSVKSVQEDFDVCLELLEASEKYGVEKLQQEMKCLLLRKEFEWSDVEGALRLFCFARCAATLTELKKLAVRLIKLNVAELEESETFKKLLQTNTDATTELFRLVAST